MVCVEGFEDGDQIQKAHVDQYGIVSFKVYEYWLGDGWADQDLMDVVGDDVGFSLGEAAWFISGTAKQITTAGGVKKTPHTHTFNQTWSVVSSAFPINFCPNSADVSWAAQDGDQIQVPWVDDYGIVQFNAYEYWTGEGWADSAAMELLDADSVITTAGKGFWYITSNPADVSFAEVSPIADPVTP